MQRVDVPGMGIVEFPDGMSDDDISKAIKANMPDERPWQQRIMQTAAAGLIRGAGSFGATALTPYDLIAGNTKSIGNPERRQAMDDAFGGMGVDTDSWLYGGAKLLAEVAGTAGAGPLLAGAAKAVPVLSKAAPVIDSIATAGMRAGGATGIPGVASRVAGGTITGGVAAGMVNPESAGTGAAIGAALPPALQLLGKAGHSAGRMIRGPEQAPDLAAAIREAQSVGYVIPPTQAKPSLLNRTMEGLAGKLTTAQNASAQNQGVTNKLAARALGLPDDTKITRDVLTGVREIAGTKYASIGGTGTIVPGPSYTQALDNIAAPHIKALQGFPNAKPSPVIDIVESLKSDTFDAAAAVAKIKELRNAADDAYRTGNTDIGRASKSAAKALEDAIDWHLQQLGQPELLQEFRQARELIAKTYSVEKALNSSTGTVEAPKLAAQLNKGKPLSGELKQAADFANRFKTASRAVEGMGSLPQSSPLDWAFAGGLTAATSNPLGMMGLLARPAARKAALSPMVQRGLLQSPPMLSFDDELIRAGLLAGPVIGADR